MLPACVAYPISRRERTATDLSDGDRQRVSFCLASNPDADCRQRPPQDVEKLAAKEGVVLQSVKEVLQGLVDDELVHMDRIGASNYFWCASCWPWQPNRLS